MKNRKLGEKYSKNFLRENKYYKTAVEKIIEQENKSGISVIDWTNEEMHEYLRSFRAISAMSINRQLFVLRNFADYICEKEGLPKRHFCLEEERLIDFIDKSKLNSLTLTVEQYMHIKNQLDQNVRDKLIFELAWYGLTNEEIKFIKIDDITFTPSDFWWDIAFIDVGREIPFKIEDPEVVEDIKKCMEDTYYIIVSKDGRVKRMRYKNSRYLIKPVSVGRNKKEEYIYSPSTTLLKAFITKEITCDGIDIYNLTIEDVRRSGLIYLLAPENEESFSLGLIAVLYGFKSESGLYWLKAFAKEKYSKR